MEVEKAVKAMSPIEQSMDQVDKSLTELRECVSRLEDRLSPLLSNYDTPTTGRDVETGDENSSSQLVRKLDSTAEMVIAQSERIMRLCARLDI